MGNELLVVGSLNMDIVVGLTRMPAVGETVLGNDLTYIPGGKGANQAYAAGKLNGNVKMLGCVGDDDFGNVQRSNLQQAGVDVSRIKTGDKTTGTATIYVDDAGNNSIAVVQGANLECDIPYIVKNEDLLRQCEYIMLQMEIPYETIYYVIRKAKENKKTVILNPAPAPVSREIPDEIYAMIDFITPNETELMHLTGVKGCSLEELERGAEILLRKGVNNVLVTIGDRGVLWANECGTQYFAAYKVEVMDTTAAGDCFNGAFAVALSENKKIEEAIRFANRAAAIAVSRKGAQSSIPRRDEVE